MVYGHKHEYTVSGVQVTKATTENLSTILRNCNINIYNYQSLPWFQADQKIET